MALTTGKWPYPLGTEPVRDGDNAIKALADESELRLAKLGLAYGAIGGGVADANGALVVSYGRTFTATPAVNVTVFDSAVLAILLKSQLFPTQFTILFKTVAGAVRPGAIEFSWVAVGPVR